MFLRNFIFLFFFEFVVVSFQFFVRYPITKSTFRGPLPLDLRGGVAQFSVQSVCRSPFAMTFFLRLLLFFLPKPNGTDTYKTLTPSDPQNQAFSLKRLSFLRFSRFCIPRPPSTLLGTHCSLIWGLVRTLLMAQD